MLHGFWKLVWVEIKVFSREPLGVLGTVAIPVIMFVLLGRIFRSGGDEAGLRRVMAGGDLPIFAAVFVALGGVVSLITIISIYRESGILKRLRATPLRPQTILGAHVAVKLVVTSMTWILLALAGKQFYSETLDVDPVSFVLALLLSTVSILSIGFVIASIVPTARFAQPIGSFILYPMLAISGLLAPLEMLPEGWRLLAGVLPVTHAVTLLQGIWSGGGWMEHWGAVAALVANFAVCTAISARIFRWE